MNNKNTVLIVLLIIIVLAGLWFWMQGSSAGTGSVATSTPPAGSPAGPGTPAVGQKTVPPAGPNAGTVFTAQVSITGFTASNQTSFPLVNYKVESNLTGQGFFSLIGQNTNTVVWGKDQAIAGSYTLDPNAITVQDGVSKKLPPGDYFIRVQNSAGTTVGESKPFRLAPGKVINN